MGIISLDRNQRRTALRSAAGLVTSASAIYAAYYWWPFALPQFADQASRFAFVIRCDLFAALMLLAGIGTIGNQRFLSSAIDGTRRPTQTRIEINLRYVQNTLEQLVLLVIGHLGLATIIPDQAMRVIPILVVWFILARLAFWYGYHRSPINRAFGMACTLFPNFGVLFFDAYHILF